jgi:hypothetical protein
MLGIAFVSVLAALLPSASAFSAFSFTTPNSGNTGTAGTVALTDNDSGTAMLTMSNAKPGDTDTSCIQVTSTGTLPSLVKLYGTTTGTGLDAYLTLTVTRGTGAAGFDDCTGFTPDAVNYAGLGAGVLHNGTLTSYPDSYAAGTTDPRTASIPEAWTTGETHSYKLQLTVADNNAAQTLNVTQAFTWEARNTTLYSQVVMSDQPASYWKLDEAAGTTATDSAGAVTGTYTNSPALNQVTGVRDAGTAVSFDGSNDGVAAGDNYGFAGTTNFSVELWLNPTDATSSYRRVISKEVTGGTIGWDLYLAASSAGVPNRLGFERKDSGGGKDIAADTGALGTGTWHHAIATYDGSSIRLYVDGTLHSTAGSARSIGATTGSPLRLGMSSDQSNVFGGLLDEVAIYTSVLSAQQVTEHYNAGRR